MPDDDVVYIGPHPKQYNKRLRVRYHNPSSGAEVECAGPGDTLMDDTVKFLIDDNGDCLIDF